MNHHDYNKKLTNQDLFLLFSEVEKIHKPLDTEVFSYNIIDNTGWN